MFPEIISQKTRVARKTHQCDYCRGNIEPGERYAVDVLKYDGTVYHWKQRLKCQYIAQELWEYIDPDDYGLDVEDFRYGCQDFCRGFVCPECPHYDGTECLKDEMYCIDKIHAILKTHSLVRCKKPQNGFRYFKLQKREEYSEK